MRTLLIYAVAVAVALTVHELAHVAAALLTGAPVRKVGLRPLGLCIVRGRIEGWREVLVCAAGPFANAVLAVAFAGVSSEFVLCNVVFAVVNLLPIEHSDGTHILEALKRKEA